MKWDTRCYPPPPPYFLSSMAQRSPTCALSHINVMRPKCIFIENLDIQDILTHRKPSHLVNSLLLTYAISVNVWEQYGVIKMMISSAAI